MDDDLAVYFVYLFVWDYFMAFREGYAGRDTQFASLGGVIAEMPGRRLHDSNDGLHEAKNEWIVYMYIRTLGG